METLLPAADSLSEEVEMKRRLQIDPEASAPRKERCQQGDRQRQMDRLAEKTV